MKRLFPCTLPALLGAFLIGCASPQDPVKDSPETRAIALLSEEVPAWHRENRCYSCHNNGDAARALFVARQQGFFVPRSALADTTAWLVSPSRWQHNSGDPSASDKQLARLQFTTALATAIATGAVHDQGKLSEAAAMLVNDQSDDGAWRGESQELIGSPTTYGESLSTWAALKTLRAVPQTDSIKLAVKRGEDWLRRSPLNNVLQAVAVALGLNGLTDERSVSQRKAALDFLFAAQRPEGGWGPFRQAAPETFDTAITLLALSEARNDPRSAEAIRRGREHLISIQKPDGAWQETTRPSHGESYAQRISTIGWATLALLETRSK